MLRVRLLQVLFLLVIFCVVSPLAAQVGRDTELWRWSGDAAHHQSIVQVKSGGGYGTGVIVNVDTDSPSSGGYLGWCLTAWHVVSENKDQRDIEVVYADGRSSKRCLVLAHDETNDVAVLWVWVPDSVPAVQVAKTAVGVGKPIEFAGLGGGSGLNCCLRHFEAETSFPTNGETIFADVALLPGDSGGPVFNADRQVVGIVSGGWFWWNGGVKNDDGREINVTWPARACNVDPILEVIEQARNWKS